MLIIGSQALKHNNPTWVVQPKDTDIIGTFDEFLKFSNENNTRNIKYNDDGNKIYFETVNEWNEFERYEWEIAHPDSLAENILNQFDDYLYAPNCVLNS
jgi:Zn/Cd-binding protein ZinT